jgi:hypothetical protein
MNCSRVLAVGHAYLAGTPLAKVAQTALDNLGKALGESCSAATLDGDNVLYIARAAVNNLLSIDLGRGRRRLPAWATSMGRVLLSALPEEQLEVTLSRATLIRYTPHTLCDLSGLRAEIARVRMQGCPRRPADRGRLVLAGGTRAVASRSGGGRPECRGTCHGQRRGVKREGSRPATARGDGSVSAAIARDCGFATVARLRQIPAASSRSSTPPSPARGCER